MECPRSISQALRRHLSAIYGKSSSGFERIQEVIIMAMADHIILFGHVYRLESGES